MASCYPCAVLRERRTFDSQTLPCYAGSVKNGFGERELKDLRPRLKALASTRTPFAGEQPRATGGDKLHFLEPRLVAQAEIAEWTGSGRLRQASFKGLREDKAPEEVRREG